MGCCLSRSTTSSSRNPTSHPNNDSTRHRNPRPPPPPMEEETVKEVLTETPFADERIEAKAAGEKKNEKLQGVVEVKPQQPRLEAFEIQEVSEITVATENRSVSESVSAATVGGEKRGEEVMSKSRAEPVVSRHQKSVDQSPAKASRRRPYSGELTAGGPREKRVRSPAKRAIPSPEKKTHVAPRPVRGRSQSPATSSNRNTVNTGPSRIRRDAGERSGRRSRSPAGKAFQNSSSSNITGAGPGSEVNAGVNVGQRQHGDVCGTSRVEEEEGCPESLDNPLVSLECFIFL